MFDALRFAPLLGYYIRAERPATDEETQAYGNDTMGGEGIVAALHDVRPGEVVIDLLDNTPIVVCDGEAWTWNVWRRAPDGR